MTHWDALDQLKFRDEREAVADLLARMPLDPLERGAVVAEAISLVERARAAANRQGVVESFLQEFSLGTREGLALMCLAEALLRTPDEDTRDRLIAEKIGSADWASHLGQSDSLFVNASTWGLMLTGKLVDVDEEARARPARLPEARRRTPRRAGDPRGGGRRRRASWASSSCWAAPSRRRSSGRTTTAGSARFDMLGEGARTAADAERYETHLRRRHRGGRQGAPRGRGPKPATASRSSCRPCRRAMRPCRKTGCGASSIPACCGWRRSRRQARHQLHHRRRGGRPPRPLAEAAGPAGPRARAGRLDAASAWRFRPIRSARPQVIAAVADLAQRSAAAA